MGASVWSGHLTVGLMSIPVRLHSAARSTGISFNMLHRSDKARVNQQYICSAEKRVIDRSEIVKGFEFRKDEYVVIDPEEIKRLQPESSKTIEILKFITAAQLDPIYFESSFYVMPGEDAGKRPYALLVKALEVSNYVGIAKLFMHNREHTVFLRPYEGGLMVHTMYYEEELRKTDGYGQIAMKLEENDLQIMERLIEAMAEDWDHSAYKDTFQENLKKLIEAKLEGGEVTEVAIPKRHAPAPDLMAALKQSLEILEAQKLAKKAKKGGK